MLKKKFFLIFMLMLMLIIACDRKTPFEPYIPEVKKYTLEVTYIRTEILQWSEVDTSLGPIFCLVSKKAGFINSRHIDFRNFQRVNDYEYTGSLSEVAATGKETFYCVYDVDLARYDGNDASSVVVGRRYIIKVIETGFKVEITDVRENHLPINPYRGPKAEMGAFQLTSDGKIILESSSH